MEGNCWIRSFKLSGFRWDLSPKKSNKLFGEVDRESEFMARVDKGFVLL